MSNAFGQTQNFGKDQRQNGSSGDSLIMVVLTENVGRIIGMLI